jgi:hypothetical protein
MHSIISETKAKTTFKIVQGGKTDRFKVEEPKNLVFY